MPDTLSSLIAKLGDCPRTEEYLAQHARLVYPESAYAEMFNEADAALLELAEKLEGALAINAECWSKREAAEARVAELAQHSVEWQQKAYDENHLKVQAQEERDWARAEVERLKARVTATEDDKNQRLDEMRAALAKQSLHIEDCHRQVEKAEANLTEAKRCWDEAETERIQAEAERDEENERWVEAQNQRDEAQEDVERLRWMLDSLAITLVEDNASAGRHSTYKGVMADLESRWAEREEAGDE